MANDVPHLELELELADDLEIHRHFLEAATRVDWSNCPRAGTMTVTQLNEICEEIMEHGRQTEDRLAVAYLNRVAGDRSKEGRLLRE